MTQPATFSAPPSPHPRGRLALYLQEAFTVAVRVRSNRQVASDATSFRLHVKQLLTGMDADARRAGYDGESVKLGVFAFIAFLDESVLNAGQPMFADWFRQPLQEEVFGEHMAGETFFRYLHDLIGRQDSEELGDVLEVFLLCLLLGFRGRYGAAPGELQGFITAAQAKLTRIRGGSPPLSPAWALPESEVAVTQRDPWIRRLGYAAAFAVLLAVLLFVGFRLALGPGVAEMRTLSAQVTP